MRFEDQLDARGIRPEPVRSGADGRLLEAVVANLLDVSFRHDPRRLRHRRRVSSHEVRPRRLEPESDVEGIDDLDGGDPIFEQLRARAPVAIEGELHVIGRDPFAVVEQDAAPERELVHQAVF